jgi:predicted aspartyl protease
MLPDSVFVPKVDSLRLQINILHTKEGKTVEALVDTGATHNFITPETAHYLNLNLTKLEKP